MQCRKVPRQHKSRPLGEGGCERSEQTEGVSACHPLIPPQALTRLRGRKRTLWVTALSGQTAGLYAAQMHFCCVKSVEVCAVIRYNKTWFIISSCGRAARHSGRVGGRDGKTVSAVLVAAGSSTRMGFDKLSFDLGAKRCCTAASAPLLSARRSPSLCWWRAKPGVVAQQAVGLPKACADRSGRGYPR